MKVEVVPKFKKITLTAPALRSFQSKESTLDKKAKTYPNLY
jgi:hypothetical protein